MVLLATHGPACLKKSKEFIYLLQAQKRSKFIC